MPNLREKAVNGVKWTSLEQVSTLLLQFVIGVVVARLVSPSDYGLIAMLAIFTSFGNMFINGGFGTALIRKKVNTPEDYSTAFLFNVTIGFIIYILLYICAPYIAEFYNTPQLVDVTRIYTLILPIVSFSIVQTAKLTHELRFKIQFYINFVTLLISGSVGILMAYNEKGVWALVWQGIIAALLRTILMWMLSGWRPVITFSRSSFHYLFSFGSKLLATNFLDVIYENIYTLVIGKFYSATSAGYYNRSLQFSQMPQSIISQVVNKVALPVLSQYQDDKEKLLNIYDRFFRLMAFLSYPLMVMLAVLARPVVLVLLGEKWLPSVPYLQILSISVIFVTLTRVNLNLFFVKGRSDVLLKIDVVKKLVGFILVAIMTPLGLMWICVGTILYAIAAFIINCNQTKKILGYGFLPQARSAIPFIVYSSLMGGVIYLVLLFVHSSFAQILFGGCSGIICYLSAAFLFKDKTLQEIVFLLNRQYGR